MYQTCYSLRLARISLVQLTKMNLIKFVLFKTFAFTPFLRHYLEIWLKQTCAETFADILSVINFVLYEMCEVE